MVMHYSLTRLGIFSSHITGVDAYYPMMNGDPEPNLNQLQMRWQPIVQTLKSLLSIQQASAIDLDWLLQWRLHSKFRSGPSWWAKSTI